MVVQLEDIAWNQVPSGASPRRQLGFNTQGIQFLAAHPKAGFRTFILAGPTIDRKPAKGLILGLGQQAVLGPLEVVVIQHNAIHRHHLLPCEALDAGAANHSRIGPIINLAWLEERSEEHTSELQSRENLVCRLLLEKKNQRVQA